MNTNPNQLLSLPQLEFIKKSAQRQAFISVLTYIVRSLLAFNLTFIADTKTKIIYEKQFKIKFCTHFRIAV